MPRGQQRQTSSHRRRSRSNSRRVPSARPSYKKELASLIEEQIGPWLTEEQKRYIHPCGTSDPFLALGLPTFAVSCSYDNLFQEELPDAYKAYQKWSGAIAVLICVSYMVVKIYEFPDLLPVQLLKSWIKFPTCPANFRIYRDTATVVIISYVLLLDINLSYLSLCIFPLIAIGFIYTLFRELCYSVEHHGEGVIKSGVEPNYTGKTTKEPEELEFIVMMPFCALCALCLMAHLDDRAADRFAISQFLLFLSSTLGVLTRMMIRLPSGASADVTPASELLQKSFLCASADVTPASELLQKSFLRASADVTPASELLQKSFLLLLFVTVHTVAAEALGEDVVMVCMPEVVPMLLWFSVHLDRESSIVSIDKIKPYTDFPFAFIAAVITLLAYLATSMDESWLSSCTAIMVACGVSGFLTYYVVFMLNQWPDEEQQGSSEEVMQLLRFWANALLIAAASLLLLKYVVSRRLGVEEPLLDALCQKFQTMLMD